MYIVIALDPEGMPFSVGPFFDYQEAHTEGGKMFSDLDWWVDQTQDPKKFTRYWESQDE